MPLGCRPGATFKVVLKSDMETTKAERPWFEFKHLSKSAWGDLVTETRKKIGAAFEEIETKIKEDKEQKVRIWAIETPDYTNLMLAAGLVNWGNIIDPDTGKPMPFDAENIDHIVTRAEAEELLAAFREQEFNAEERKN
jgi:hypothetical protein